MIPILISGSGHSWGRASVEVFSWSRRNFPGQAFKAARIARIEMDRRYGHKLLELHMFAAVWSCRTEIAPLRLVVELRPGVSVIYVMNV